MEENIMVYVPTIVGEVGAFLFNIVILSYVIKYDANVSEWNRIHRIKKQTVFRPLLLSYFIAWIITSFVAWYSLHFIQLGEFFAVSVVLPVMIVSFVKWVMT